MFSKRCPDCGASECFRSRRRTFFEKCFLPLVLGRPARCAKCFRRRYVSLWVDVRAEDIAALGPAEGGMNMRQYDEFMRQWRWWLPR